MEIKVLDRTQTNGIRVGMKVMGVSHTTCCFQPTRVSGKILKVVSINCRTLVECALCGAAMEITQATSERGTFIALCNWLPVPDESDSQELTYTADKTKEKQT